MSFRIMTAKKGALQSFFLKILQFDCNLTSWTFWRILVSFISGGFECRFTPKNTNWQQQAVRKMKRRGFLWQKTTRFLFRRLPAGCHRQDGHYGDTSGRNCYRRHSHGGQQPGCSLLRPARTTPARETNPKGPLYSQWENSNTLKEYLKRIWAYMYDRGPGPCHTRNVCNVLGLMFSIWHTSWLSSQSPNLLSLPLLAISFIFTTKLLKLVSSSSTSEAVSRLPRRYCAQLI